MKQAKITVHSEDTSAILQKPVETRVEDPVKKQEAAPVIQAKAAGAVPHVSFPATAGTNIAERPVSAGHQKKEALAAEKSAPAVMNSTEPVAPPALPPTIHEASPSDEGGEEGKAKPDMLPSHVQEVDDNNLEDHQLTKENSNNDEFVEAMVSMQHATLDQDEHTAEEDATELVAQLSSPTDAELESGAIEVPAADDFPLETTDSIVPAEEAPLVKERSVAAVTEVGSDRAVEGDRDAEEMDAEVEQVAAAMSELMDEGNQEEIEVDDVPDAEESAMTAMALHVAPPKDNDA